MYRIRLLGLALVCVLAVAATAQDNQPIPGIGPIGGITKLHTGFKFTEGPAADAEGNLYFSDIPNNRILKVDPNGELSVFLENTQGCNGLMVDGRGRLIACQGGTGFVIAIDLKTKELQVVAGEHQSKPFNGPNDLVIDRQGGIYFTDPREGKNQDKPAVYYATPRGPVTRLIDNLVFPNGVILSPDEKTLYVLPARSPEVMAYPVQAPGKIGPGKVLCRLEQDPQGKPRGGDGLTVDTKGNLYLTQPGLNAIQVVTPEGKTLGLIKFPERPANCTFGGKDMKTLYVTAQTSLYTAKMEATGHRFASGGQ
jgi:gluconolactonase